MRDRLAAQPVSSRGERASPSPSLAAANGLLANAVGRSRARAAMLCELGIAYQARSEGSRSARTSKRLAAGALVLPSAFLVQVPSTASDDPRSLRGCLGFVESVMVPAVVSTVVGRPLAVTGPLALQEVWEVLSAPDAIASRVRELLSGVPGKPGCSTPSNAQAAK